jgi:hypothetical protein
LEFEKKRSTLENLPKLEFFGLKTNHLATLKKLFGKEVYFFYGDQGDRSLLFATGSSNAST